MDPILIVIGLVLCLLPLPGRVKAVAIAVLALLRGLVIGYDSADGVADAILAVIVAAANIGIGFIVGTAIGLLIEGRRPRPRSF